MLFPFSYGGQMRMRTKQYAKLERLLYKTTHDLMDGIVQAAVNILLADVEFVGALQALDAEPKSNTTHIEFDYPEMAEAYARNGEQGVYAYLRTEGITTDAPFIFTNVFLPEWERRGLALG